MNKLITLLWEYRADLLVELNANKKEIETINTIIKYLEKLERRET